jgi:serine/threonine protein kinase
MGAATRNQKSDVPAGTRFGEGGRYEIRERIGRGGMADVYKVADRKMGDKIFALKLLSVEDDVGLSESRRREIAKLRSLFLEESLALSRVHDSNVVAIISNGHLSDEKQTPYMLMEYLDGTDLNGLLRKLAKEGQRLAIDRAAEIILGVCAGIQACHSAGVIHRDLKPANIFLERTAKGEVVKVLDFSVAKVPVSRDQTKTDFVIGTEDYMAPEQRDRKPATELSDQYSIGALLYKCLTGDAPRGFFAKPSEKRPEIPEALEAAILRAMNPKPELRFANVHELGQAVHPFATAEARARWKHYYTTPPLPVRAAFTGPIVPRSRMGIPEVIPTRVEAYDFKKHDRTTSLGDDSLALPTTVDRPSDGIPSVIEAPSLVDIGPPTAGSGPRTDVDPPNSHRISGAVGSAVTAGSQPAQPENGAPESRGLRSEVTRPRYNRLAFAAGLLLPVIIGGGLLLRWYSHRGEAVPATAPAWTRTVLESPAALPVKANPAAPAAAAGSPVAAPALPPTPAPALETQSPQSPSARAEADQNAAAVEPPDADRPHHKKKAPKIRYDDDGFPILH